MATSGLSSGANNAALDIWTAIDATVNQVPPLLYLSEVNHLDPTDSSDANFISQKDEILEKTKNFPLLMLDVCNEVKSTIDQAYALEIQINTRIQELLDAGKTAQGQALESSADTLYSQLEDIVVPSTGIADSIVIAWNNIKDEIENYKSLMDAFNRDKNDLALFIGDVQYFRTFKEKANRIDYGNDSNTSAMRDNIVIEDVLDPSGAVGAQYVNINPFLRRVSGPRSIIQAVHPVVVSNVSTVQSLYNTASADSILSQLQDLL